MMSKILLSLLLFTGIACKHATSTTAFTQQTVVVLKGEHRTIDAIGFKIFNGGCGREWHTNDDGHAAEKVTCDLTYTYRGEVIKAGENFDTIRMGDLAITVESMNSWGVMEDSVPPGGCRILVQKVLQ